MSEHERAWDAGHRDGFRDAAHDEILPLPTIADLTPYRSGYAIGVKAGLNYQRLSAPEAR